MVVRTPMTSERAAVVPDLVSVITPCYNAAPYVAEAIAAVRAQTYAPVEQVVVDDGSTDASWAAIQAATAAAAPLRPGARAPRGAGLRAVRLAQNRGAAHARNVGVGLARGAYLLFLDADDLLAPDTVAALVAAVRDRPGTLGVCPWQLLRRTRAGSWVRVPPAASLPAPGADHLRDVLTGAWQVPINAMLWQRDVYARTGGWDEALSLDDDTDLKARAMLDGITLARAAGGEAYYRLHGTARLSMTKNLFSTRALGSRVRVLDKLAAALEARGRLAEYAVPLGAAYQGVALFAYQQGFATLGHECQARGEQLAGGRQLASRTRLGRLLSRVLGLERKERVLQTLAAWGLGSRDRRERIRLRTKHHSLPGTAPDTSTPI